jgi:hypothetical protein
LIAGAGASIGGSLNFEGTIEGSSLTVSGSTTFNGVTFVLSNTLLGSSPLVAALGQVVFQGSDNQVDLVTYNGGQTLTILTHTLGNQDWSAYFSPEITVGGSPLGNRQSAELLFSQNKVELVMSNSGNNLVLEWTGANSDTWNSSEDNFQDDTEAPISFVSGDYVLFDGLGQGEVSVATPVTVSGMEVESGNYLFTGGDIMGTPVATGSQVNPTAKLIIEASAVAEFQVRAAFVNGMEIRGKAILSGSGSFASMSIDNYGILEINKDSDYVLSGNLTGNGNLEKRGKGLLTLSGNQDAATGLLEHMEGTLALQSNWGGDYVSDPGTTLYTSENVQIANDASFTGLVNPTGLLTVGGQASFNGATLLVDLAGGDRVTASTSDFQGNNTLILEESGIETGVFPIFSQNLALASSVLEHFSLASITLPNRVQAELSLSSDSKSIVLASSIINLVLTWQGGGIWDNTKTNWSSNESFVTGDQAIFNGLGTGDVTLNADITAGKVEVTSGNYNFIGTGLLTAKASSNLAGSDGSLTVSGGQLRIANAGGGNFEGDVLIADGELVLVSDLHTDKDLLVESGGRLAIEGAIQGIYHALPMITANNIRVDGALEARIVSLTEVVASEPLVFIVATADNEVTLNSQDSSAELAYYDYSFQRNGSNLELNIIPKNDTSIGEGILETAGGSISTSSMATSILTAIKNGVPIEGPLNQALLDLANSQTPAEGRAILSDLSGGVLVQGVAIAEGILINNSYELTSILGFEPLGHLDFGVYTSSNPPPAISSS